MTDHRPPSELELADIETRHQAATAGPWERDAEYGPNFFANVSGPYLRGVGDFNFGVGEQADADEEFVRHAAVDVGVLLAALRRAHARITELEGEHAKLVRWHGEDEKALVAVRARHKASLHRADEMNNQLMEEVQRYAEGTERPVLWSVYNRMHGRALNAEADLKRLADGRAVVDRVVVEQVRVIVRRLAAHAVGFQDVLDDSDRGPWGATVGADIAALQAAVDAPSAPSTACVGVSPASEAAGDGRGAETAAQSRSGIPGVTGVPQTPAPATEAPDPHTTPQSAPQGRTGATEEAR